MSLKKSGVVVDCAHCEYASSDSSGAFDVTVPLSDVATGIEGKAKLRCFISSEQHEVELKEWNDSRAHPIRYSPEVQRRLSAALDHVAEHRICGNRQICPREVVRIVEKNSGI
jgi:hypothetical protein